MDDPTLSTLTLYEGFQSKHSYCLVVLWQREDTQTLGAVSFLPPAGTVVVGRGETSDLTWLLHRPQGMDSPIVQPLASPRISRTQLEISVEEDHLFIKNIGRCPMQLSGVRCEEGRVHVGQIIELEREVTLLVTRRSRQFPAVSGFDHRFASKDGFGFTGESPGTWEIRHQISMVLATKGHLIIRGADGTGRKRLARALNAKPFLWRKDPTLSHVDNLWIDDPHAWFEQRPGQAESMAKVMQSNDRRLILTLNSDKGDLSFTHSAMFPLRLNLPGFEERKPDLVLIAAQMLRDLRLELPDAKKCFVNDRPLFSGKWVRFLMQRQWTAHAAELRSLLIEAVHQSKQGWIHPPEQTDVEPVHTGSLRKAMTQTTSKRLKFSDCVVDLERRVVTRGVDVVGITPMELNLLRYLLNRQGQEVTKPELLTEVWGYKPDIETQAVENTIRRLRRKIEPNPKKPCHILSVWGVGYRFELHQSDEHSE